MEILDFFCTWKNQDILMKFYKIFFHKFIVSGKPSELYVC